MKLAQLIELADAALDAAMHDDPKLSGHLRNLRDQLVQSRGLRDPFSTLVYNARQHYEGTRYSHLQFRDRDASAARKFFERAIALGYKGTEEEWRRVVEFRPAQPPDPS